MLRFANFYKKLNSLINVEKKIGDIISLEFNETLHYEHGGYIMGDWRRLEEPSGGMLLEKCCHDFDLINWIVGSRAKKVASFGGLNFFVPKYEHRMKEIEYLRFLIFFYNPIFSKFTDSRCLQDLGRVYKGKSVYFRKGYN